MWIYKAVWYIIKLDHFISWTHFRVLSFLFIKCRNFWFGHKVISRTSFWDSFCITKWFNVIIIKLLVLPLNCFKRTIFSGKIPCPVINIFPGMVVEVLFVTWCFYNTYIRDQVYSKYISEIMKQPLDFLSMPYSYRALFQQLYDDTLFSS